MSLDSHSADHLDQQILANEFSYSGAGAPGEKVIDAEVREIVPRFKGKQSILVAALAGVFALGAGGVLLFGKSAPVPAAEIPADVAEITRVADAPGFKPQVVNGKEQSSQQLADVPPAKQQEPLPQEKPVAVSVAAAPAPAPAPSSAADSGQSSASAVPATKEPSPKQVGSSDVESLKRRIAELEQAASAKAKAVKDQPTKEKDVAKEKDASVKAKEEQKPQVRHASLASMGIVALLNDGVVVTINDKEYDVPVGANSKHFGGKVLAVDPARKTVETSRTTWIFH